MSDRIRLGVVLAGLLALGLGLARAAVAQVRLDELRVSARPGGESAERFDPGIRAVYATFRYREASDHRIAVTVLARGGLIAFEAAQRYSGSGTATVAIDGTSVCRQLAGDLEEAALAARANAEQAAAQQHGVQEYLSAVQQDLLVVEQAAALLGTVALGNANAGRLASIRVASGEAMRLVRRAIGLAPGEVDRKRAIAAELQAPLQEIAANAMQLTRSVAGLSDLPIPETGLHPHASYTVQVRLQDPDYLALSAEFSVARLPTLVLPWLGRGTVFGR